MRPAWMFYRYLSICPLLTWLWHGTPGRMETQGINGYARILFMRLVRLQFDDARAFPHSACCGKDEGVPTALGGPQGSKRQAWIDQCGNEPTAANKMFPA